MNSLIQHVGIESDDVYKHVPITAHPLSGYVKCGNSAHGEPTMYYINAPYHNTIECGLIDICWSGGQSKLQACEWLLQQPSAAHRITSVSLYVERSTAGCHHLWLRASTNSVTVQTDILGCGVALAGKSHR
jgi:hypothetical protein